MKYDFNIETIEGYVDMVVVIVLLFFNGLLKLKCWVFLLESLSGPLSQIFICRSKSDGCSPFIEH